LCPIFLGNVTPKTSNPVALKIGHKRFSRHVAFSGDINQPQQQKKQIHQVTKKNTTNSQTPHPLANRLANPHQPKNLFAINDPT